MAQRAESDTPSEAVASALVLLGGSGSPESVPEMPRGALVIAADSGLHLAAELGLKADVVVGDMDSVAPSALDAARSHGAEIITHPTDKDETDLELALEEAVRRGVRRVHVLGGPYGRVDHHLANVGVLTSPRLREIDVVAHLGQALLTVVRSSASLRGRPGEIVSLLAAGGPASEVTTRGLRWELSGETLVPWSTRGVSNEFIDGRALISVGDGALVAVQPLFRAKAPGQPEDESSGGQRW